MEPEKKFLNLWKIIFTNNFKKTNMLNMPILQNIQKYELLNFKLLLLLLLWNEFVPHLAYFFTLQKKNMQTYEVTNPGNDKWYVENQQTQRI